MIEETPPYARSGSFASMDTPGPYETRATQAFYYVTPVEKDWDAQHAEEHLRLYNPPVVAMINVHEAYPGHYLQFLYAKQFPTKIRKLLACVTNAEGWAHYCEQMMVDEGFGGGDPKIRLAQLQEALLARLPLRGRHQAAHRGLDGRAGCQAVRRARRFRSRRTLMRKRAAGVQPHVSLLHLRQVGDPEASRRFPRQEGGSLRDFHDAFVAQGALPLPLVRKILLGE